MKLVRFMLIALLTATTLNAQPGEGRKRELSLSGTYQNFSSGTSSGSSNAFLFSTRAGFFVLEGLELEPEIMLLLSSGPVPVYLISGNISYNFISAGKGVPFVLLGYGIANTVPMFNVPFLSTDFGVGVLNAGVGAKTFLRENIALRVEYRYQKFSGEGRTGTDGFSTFTQRVDARIHTVQFGLSVLL